jgi:nucleotide-binding universal stress UspA family protein
MFRRILVPLDGTEGAERAVPVAARIARASGGAIILVRAVSTTPELWPSRDSNL